MNVAASQPRYPNLFRALALLFGFGTLLALLLLLLMHLPDTSAPPPPEDDTCLPFDIGTMEGWSNLRYEEHFGFDYERIYYADINGVETYVGTAKILETPVPAEIQSTVGLPKINNPSITVWREFRGNGIGEYLLRDIISRYPDGTPFLWQQDPAEASGSYTWRCFKQDHPFEENLGVPKSAEFPNGIFSWFKK